MIFYKDTVILNMILLHAVNYPENYNTEKCSTSVSRSYRFIDHEYLSILIFFLNSRLIIIFERRNILNHQKLGITYVLKVLAQNIYSSFFLMNRFIETSIIYNKLHLNA
ncbi:hypothetical protein NQ318_016840 [Aromia moschata]|uniref:Uncharacterized protein n=1 Tax=Aromia moschata TaxID=1265417 RepID=A0AAV8YVA1_9CUCU|nr:hypothetical protein NQ318_016840 [Aromia moschata]